MRKKLSRGEYQKTVEGLRAILPAEWKDRLRAGAPYALNHQVLLNVEPGGWSEIRRAKLAVEKALCEAAFKIKGETVKVGIQNSPARRTLCANVFRSVDALRKVGVPDEHMEVCQRTLALHRLPSYDVIGRSAKAADGGGWRWTASVIADMGLDLQKVEEAVRDLAQ